MNEVNEVVREVPGESGGTNKVGDSPIVEDEEDEVNIDRDELVNPAWIEDPRLGDGKVDQMNEREIQFFQVYDSIKMLALMGCISVERMMRTCEVNIDL